MLSFKPLEVTPFQSMLWAGIYAYWSPSLCGEIDAHITFAHDLQVFKVLRYIIGTGFLATTTPYAKFLILLDREVIGNVEGSAGAYRVASRVFTMIAGRRVMIVSGMRVLSGLVIAYLPEEHADVQAVLFLTGNLAGATAYTVLAIEVKAQSAHCVTCSYFSAIQVRANRGVQSAVSNSSMTPESISMYSLASLAIIG
jgi:hypothetical protein